MHILFILAFVLLGSAQDVFLGHFFETEDPIAVVFFTFLIALVILQAAFFIKKPNTFEQIARNRRKLFALNGVTALNWITFFVALKYIQPAIVGAIAFSIGPAVTTAFGHILRPSTPRPSMRLWLTSIGIILTSIFLAYCSISGNSALRTTDPVMAVFGILLAVMSGIGMTLNTYCSKSLSESELTTRSITAFRFIALVVLSGAITLFGSSGLSAFIPEVYLSVIAIAILGIVLPMTLIQIGVKGTEPRLVAALLALTPATTLIFEAMDSRLHFSAESVIGVTLLCLFAVAGALP